MTDNPYQSPQAIETAAPQANTGDGMVWRISRALLLGCVGFGIYLLMIYWSGQWYFVGELIVAGLLIGVSMATSELYYLPVYGLNHSVVRRLMVSTPLLLITFLVVSVIMTIFFGNQWRPSRGASVQGVLGLAPMVWLAFLSTYVLLIVLVRIPLALQVKQSR